MNFRASLGKLGLNHHEAIVYEALLERSPAGASWLARKCGLARSSVYTTLASLVDKGLVGTTHEGSHGTKQFVAEGHGALMELLDREQARAAARLALGESLRAEFERLRSGEGEPRAQVMFFEGQEGLQRVYLSMLREMPGETTLYLLRDEFLFGPDWSFVFEEPWKEHVRSLKSGKKIATRLLVNRSAEEQRQLPYYRSRQGLEVRFLPEGTTVERFALYVAGSVAAILSMEDANLVGIRLANAHLAANFAALHRVLWAVSQGG